MHSTSIIILLQKLQNPLLTTLMNWITLLGYELGVTIILCIFLFGFSFHKGFFLMQSYFSTVFISSFMKNIFFSNRPFVIDNRIKNLDYTMIKEFNEGLVSYSFPSNHASQITSIALSISLILKKRIVYILSSIIVLLVLISRLYLGVHYLQDVLGGFALAIIITLIYYIPLKKHIEGNRNFPFNLTQTKNGQLAYFIFFIFLPFLLIFIPVEFDKSQIGFLIGANLGYFLLGKNFKQSYIEYKINLISIGLRVIIGFAIYMILRLGLSFIFNLVFPDKLVGLVYFRVVRYFLVGLFTVGLSVIFFIKLKLAYKVD